MSVFDRLAGQEDVVAQLQAAAAAARQMVADTVENTSSPAESLSLIHI